MIIGEHAIGVCEWSLKTPNVKELVVALNALELTHVQVGLMPLLDRSLEYREDYVTTLNEAGIEIVSGMIGFADENYSTIASIRKTGGFVSPQLWPVRRDRAIAVAKLAEDMGITQVTAHAGFIPPSGDPSYAEVVNNLGQLAAEYQKHDVEFLLETGQESARELLQFLNDLNAPNVGVNFDPANMILYGSGDPTEAVDTLGRHIRHVHIKDAEPSTQPNIEWGHEVPFGEGAVDVHALLRTLNDVGYDGPLVVERETGTTRLEDVRTAIETLIAHYGE